MAIFFKFAINIDGIQSVDKNPTKEIIVIQCIPRTHSIGNDKNRKDQIFVAFPLSIFDYLSVI